MTISVTLNGENANLTFDIETTLNEHRLRQLIQDAATGNDQDTITIRWGIDDVKAQYDTMFTDWDVEPECGPLNDDDFRQILRFISKAHDANVGISWEVVEAHIDSFIRNRMVSRARPPVSPEEREGITHQPIG